MPASITIKEPKILAETRSPFGLNAVGHPMFECIRILSGSVDLVQKSTGKTTSPRSCHLTLRNRKIKRTTTNDIIRDIYGEEDTDFVNFERRLIASASRNKEFWADVNAELCHIVFSLNTNRQVDAFLHLYRLHEKISVALPLIYAHSESNFKNALEFFRSLSKDDRDGELTVFRNFVTKRIGNSDLYKNLEIDISLEKIDSSHRARALKEIADSLGILEGKSKYSVDEELKIITMNFRDFPSFIVSIRNRTFHYSNSMKNIDLDGCGGANGLFACVTPPLLYCISQVIAEIVRSQINY